MKTDLSSHVEHILEQLRAERALLDQAIADLQNLTEHRKRPRGRPRKIPSAPSDSRVRVATASAGIGGLSG